MKKLTILLLTLSVCVWAADFWTAKPYTDWSEKDVAKMLTNSPWVHQVTVPISGGGGEGGGGGQRGGKGGGRNTPGGMGEAGGGGGSAPPGGGGGGGRGATPGAGMRGASGGAG